MDELIVAIRFELMYMVSRWTNSAYANTELARKNWLLSTWARMDNYIADNNL